MQDTSDKRGLYLDCKNLSKDTVEFPMFTGEIDDNVYEFIKEFRHALIANQVAERDKVAKLLKCLSGTAKDKIGSHYANTEEALTELRSYFGNPHVLWSQEVEKFKKQFSSKKGWGSYGNQSHVLAIATVLEFIRKAKKYASDFIELKSDIESTFTTNTIRRS